MYATKKSVATLAARHGGVCTSAQLADQHPIWSVLKVIYVSCSYGFITCVAKTPVLPEICLLPAQSACRNIITICTPTQKNRGFSFLATTFVVRQMQLHRAELLFLLGIASLQRQDSPSDGQPMNFQEPWRMCKACPNLFFCGALAPRLANAPFVET